MPAASTTSSAASSAPNAPASPTRNAAPDIAPAAAPAAADPAAAAPVECTQPLAVYRALLERAGVQVTQRGTGNPVISHVSCDSRDVVPGTLFICKGAGFKPAYLEAALANGAVAYVAREPIPGCATPLLAVDDIRCAMGVLADATWDHPSGRIDVCAITGTRGKTTTAYCLRAILNARAARRGEPRCPLFSTIMIDDGLSTEPAVLTTPEPLDLQRHLARAAASGASALVMEASSQALKYGRMAGVDVAVGAFLNISEDHISPIEHPTFEDYLAAKLRLFEHAQRAVINLDMDPAYLPRVRATAATCADVLTFSCRDHAADVYAENVRPEDGCLAFDLVHAGAAHPMRLSLLGSYNVENALAAAACALALGATIDDIRTGFAQVSVPGRMEIAYADDNLSVIVDYAHNGGSLEALLTDVRAAYPGRELTCLFGATGTKGVERRYGMGAAAGRLADRIVATEDDPGTEDPAVICDAIEQAAREAGADRADGPIPITTILSREDAIRYALETAQRPAVVVLAGKGHETFMIHGTRHDPYAGDGLAVRRIMGR